MTQLFNAFSLNMIAEFPVTVHISELTREEARAMLAEHGFVSGVGHANTAAVFSHELGLHVEANRMTVSLNPGDSVVVGQFSGPRLAEGATELPEGATIKWLHVTIQRIV